MRDASDPVVLEALAKLSVESEELADEADSALHTLIWDEGLESLTQFALQEYLWYHLPARTSPSSTHVRRTARALGRLLELVALPRYASICGSELTVSIHDAYARSRSAGLAAFRRAHDGSGVKPPDLPELRWATKMGNDELQAFLSAAAALELAVVSGELRPGTRGWRSAQRDVVRRHLNFPRSDLGEQTFFHAVMTERISAWAEGSGPQRRRIISPLVNTLLSPVSAPASAAEMVAGMRWFLTAIGDGQPLTRNRFLNGPFVVAAAKHLGWEHGSSPRSEVEVAELHRLHGFAHRMGAVRRSRERLVLTPAGRTYLNDTGALWRAISQHLASGDTLIGAAAELAFARLLTNAGGGATFAELSAEVAAALAQEGWQHPSTRQAPDATTVGHAIWHTVKLAEQLDVMVVQSGADDTRLWLTAGGRACATEALRARATGPARR